MMSIFELRQRNSGIIGGKFLEASRVPKPGSDPEYPDYYTPGDFAIGSSIRGKSCVILFSSKLENTKVFINIALYLYITVVQKKLFFLNLCCKRLFPLYDPKNDNRQNFSKKF